MSSLTAFRDHCHKMAAADHKPECPSLPKNQPYWSMWRLMFDADGVVESMAWNGPPPPAPKCAGCLNDADRALFARLAAEVDDYLAPQVDLFGELTDEPETPLTDEPTEETA